MFGFFAGIYITVHLNFVFIAGELFASEFLFLFCFFLLSNEWHALQSNMLKRHTLTEREVLSFTV